MENLHIELPYCIENNKPFENWLDCECYKKRLVFNFFGKALSVTMCRGWFNYVYCEFGRDRIIDIINESVPEHKLNEFYWETRKSYNAFIYGRNQDIEKFDVPFYLSLYPFTVCTKIPLARLFGITDMELSELYRADIVHTSGTTRATGGLYGFQKSDTWPSESKVCKQLNHTCLLNFNLLKQSLNPKIFRKKNWEKIEFLTKKLLNYGDATTVENHNHGRTTTPHVKRDDAFLQKVDFN